MTAADSALTIYLMTFGPGPRVWERFGHNAIWVHDPSGGTEQAYNFGLFDFHQQNFLLRFIRGQMWYWMAGFPAESYARQYRRDDRSIWVQELELTPPQRAELRRNLEWNARPENRFYHYDYYRDNCSTRVRDALDRVLRGAIRAQTAATPTGTTYRFHTQRLTANDRLAYTGLLSALGRGVDRPISAWEEMFLPLKLRERIRAVTVPGRDGRRIPLVKSEREVYRSTLPMPPERPPDWVAGYLMVGILLGASFLGLAALGRESGVARAGFALLGTGWALVVGLSGLVLAGLWGLTDHVMAYRNENLLQLTPLVLPLVGLLVPLARGRRWAGGPAIFFAGIVAGGAVLGLAIKLVPGLHQVNGPIVALALPAHLGLWLGIGRLRRRVDPDGEAWGGTDRVHSSSRKPSAAASTASPGAIRRA